MTLEDALKTIENAIRIEHFNTLHQISEWLEKRVTKPTPDKLADDFRVKVTGKDILAFRAGRLPK